MKSEGPGGSKQRGMNVMILTFVRLTFWKMVSKELMQFELKIYMYTSGIRMTCEHKTFV